MSRGISGYRAELTSNWCSFTFKSEILYKRKVTINSCYTPLNTHNAMLLSLFSVGCSEIAKRRNLLMLATSKGHFNQHFKIIFADAPPYFQLHYKTNFFLHNFPWFVNVLKSVSNLKVTKSQNLLKLVDIDVTALEESFDIWRSVQTHSVMILNHYFWSWRVSWECYNGCGVVSWYWVSPVLLPHSWSQVVTGRETSFSWFLVTSSAWCQVVTRLGPHQRTQLWPSQSSVDFYLWEVSQPDTNHHIRDSPAVRTGFWLMLISDTSDCDDHAANIVIWNISVRLKMRWRRSSLAVRLLTLTLILHHSQAQKKFAEKVEKVLKSKSSTEKPKLLTGKQSNFNASSCGPTCKYCFLQARDTDIWYFATILQ